jgi:hypothetical protein
MAFEELLAAGLLGAVAGVISSWLTARAQVKAVRETYDGRIRELERIREHELEDRDTAETEAATAAAAELRRAASRMVSALKNPDVMERNVSVAQRDLESAAAAVSDPQVRQVADELLQAAGARDIERLETAVRNL